MALPFRKVSSGIPSIEKQRSEFMSKEQEVDVPEIKVDQEAANLIDPEIDYEPQQVKPEKVIFVPTEDFDGRINQLDFTFIQGVKVECTREEANTWVEAKKGWIQE